MSLEQIIDNIKENIMNRRGDSTILSVLESLTRKPVSFVNMIDDGKFSDFEGEETEQLPLIRLQGFKKAVKLSDNLKRFVTNGDFGFDTSDLNTVTRGISDRVVLTNLFTLYAKVNNMQNKNNKQYLSATPLMREIFSSTFNNLQKKYPFNPDNFRYATLQSIINDNISVVEIEQEDVDKIADMLNADLDLVRKQVEQIVPKNKGRNITIVLDPMTDGLKLPTSNDDK